MFETRKRRTKHSNDQNNNVSQQTIFLTPDMSTGTLRRRQTEEEKTVIRLRNTMPDKFATICKMHLSFVLDLDGSSLEELLNDDKVEIKKKSATPFSKKKDKAPSLFGHPLNHDSVAEIYPLIEYLGRSENLKSEGLFRKCGNIHRQRFLKARLNSGTGDLGLEDGMFTAHDCAAVLKNFLGELPEPLLTDKHYVAHCQVADMSHSNTERERFQPKIKQLKALQLLIQLLPRENSLILECILDLLHRVAKDDKNRMTSSALGTIFAPHLLFPRKVPPKELHAMSGKSSRAITFLIEHALQLFKIPKDFALDVANFWKDMEDPNKCLERSRKSSGDSESSHETQENDDVIHTVITFADRKLSQEEDSSLDTQVALAELYAHVQTMPESAKKRKLLKQFNRANTMSTQKSSFSKHLRSKTIGESIKKHFPILQKHKRRGSNYNTPQDKNEVNLKISLQNRENCPKEQSEVICNRLASDSSPISTPISTPRARLFQGYELGSPAVHIVDLCASPKLSRGRTRKRRSNESLESVLAGTECDKSTEKIPSSENEIQYLVVEAPDRKCFPGTPDYRGKPIAYVSPITQSVTKAPKAVQKSLMTPRSRAPMSLHPVSPATYESAC